MDYIGVPCEISLYGPKRYKKKELMGAPNADELL